MIPSDDAGFPEKTLVFSFVFSTFRNRTDADGRCDVLLYPDNATSHTLTFLAVKSSDIVKIGLGDMFSIPQQRQNIQEELDHSLLCPNPDSNLLLYYCPGP